MRFLLSICGRLDALMTHLNWSHRYSVEDVGNAPTSAGLYAWYGIPDAGPPDWRMDVRGGEDQGEKNSRRLLMNHTGRFHGPNLEIEAIGGFSTTWSGKLGNSSNARLQEVLEHRSIADGDEQQKAPKLQEPLSSPVKRKLLFQTLASRLGTHARMLYEFWGLPLQDLNEDDLNNHDLRTTAEALEWLLNCWHRPPLGRR